MAFATQTVMVRRLTLVAVLAWGVLLGGVAWADTFTLANGESLSGEMLLGSANDEGVQIKLGEGNYKKVTWANFSQEDLKKFAKVAKLEPLVQPFIEITQAEKVKRTEVNIKQPPRLELPAKRSLLGAMFSSGPGLLIMLLLYAANIYAAYEIAIFRARPVPIVCGVAAVAPMVGPIVFLCLPTLIAPVEETWAPSPEAAPQGAAAEAVNPMQAAGAEHPTGLHLAGSASGTPAAGGHFESAPEKPAIPETVVFQRGQFTFNRRFFETKFPGFFGVVRRDADKDMVLVIKSTRGEHAGERITRIAANDLHLQVHAGHATEEVMIPFVEIKEIRLKHKNAK